MKINPWAAWLSPQLWPETSPAGYMFLPEAFNCLGEIAFGEQWTTHEVEESCKDFPDQFPEADRVFLADGSVHYGFFRHYEPKMRALCSRGTEIDRDFWNFVQTDAEKERREIQAAIFRRDYIENLMGDLARSGALKFFARKRFRGGALQAIASEEWQIDYPFVPFATLGYDEANGLCSATPTHWLFVSVESLRAVIVGDGASENAVASIDVAAAANERDEMTRALAAQFDSEGIVIRDVKASLINARWNHAEMLPPKVEAVTHFMTGGGKGGRPREVKPPRRN